MDKIVKKVHSKKDKSNGTDVTVKVDFFDPELIVSHFSRKDGMYFLYDGNVYFSKAAKADEWNKLIKKGKIPNSRLHDLKQLKVEVDFEKLAADLEQAINSLNYSSYHGHFFNPRNYIVSNYISFAGVVLLHCGFPRIGALLALNLKNPIKRFLFLREVQFLVSQYKDGKLKDNVIPAYTSGPKMRIYECPNGVVFSDLLTKRGRGERSHPFTPKESINLNVDASEPLPMKEYSRPQYSPSEMIRLKKLVNTRVDQIKDVSFNLNDDDDEEVEGYDEIDSVAQKVECMDLGKENENEKGTIEEIKKTKNPFDPSPIQNKIDFTIQSKKNKPPIPVPRKRVSKQKSLETKKKKEEQVLAEKKEEKTEDEKQWSRIVEQMETTKIDVATKEIVEIDGESELNVEDALDEIDTMLEDSKIQESNLSDSDKIMMYFNNVPEILKLQDDNTYKNLLQRDKVLKVESYLDGLKLKSVIEAARESMRVEGTKLNNNPLIKKLKEVLILTRETDQDLLFEMSFV